GSAPDRNPTTMATTTSATTIASNQFTGRVWTRRRFGTVGRAASRSVVRDRHWRDVAVGRDDRVVPGLQLAEVDDRRLLLGDLDAHDVLLAGALEDRQGDVVA